MLSRIIALLSSKYSHRTNTLRELSKDDQGNYLTGIISKGYDFDAITGDAYKSCDALVINDKGLIFIEFKNQPANRKDEMKVKKLKCDLKLKAVESLIKLFDLLKENNITDSFYDLCNLQKRLIVVYSSEKTKMNYILKDRLAYNSEIKFDLAKYGGTLYNKVNTWSDDVFDNNHKILN